MYVEKQTVGAVTYESQGAVFVLPDSLNCSHKEHLFHCKLSGSYTTHMHPGSTGTPCSYRGNITHKLDNSSGICTIATVNADTWEYTQNVYFM